jgi:formylglycine-generating enzyme required for sulfatase activity/serine/threonine protein kinase
MDSSPTLPGTRLGEQITRDYKIVRLLGKGGMGEVYLAEQLRVGRRRVALKVLSRACSEDPDLARRFENEAASAGQIQHRNVVMIYECRGTDDGQLYVAMEFVDGRTLREEIADRGALPLDEVIDIAKQVSAGLGAAHRLGIVHRDIKPDNIMLLRDEEGARVAKILDFGIARLSEVTVAARTQSGVVMGTPYYMSPEQALGYTGDKIDLRSDIYSLGMVVYQMLTGRVAFESDSWMGVMYKHIHEPPPAPREFRPELGWYEELEQVVLRTLEKDRNNRPQSAQEFAASLESAYQRAVASNPDLATTANYDRTVIGVGTRSAASATGVRSSAGTAGGASPVTAAPPATASTLESRPVLRRRGAMIGIAAALILICATAVYFLWGRPETTRAPAATTESTVPSGPKPMPPSQIAAFDVVRLDADGHLGISRRLQIAYINERIDGEIGIDLSQLPGGKFLMGSLPDKRKERFPNEYPQHSVEIADFFMSSYEVTEAQWQAVSRFPQVKRELDQSPSTFKGDGTMPVENVSWWDAVEFCDRLSRATGRRYSLPTEAQWEYACRAGTETPFNLGETITADFVNYDANYPFGNAPKGVTRRKPVAEGAMNASNAFGLYDMHGNVAEWTLDYWHDSYIGAPADGRAWQNGGDANNRVVRGGSYIDGGDNCRSAVRVKDTPDIKTPYIGFRVVMTLK